MPTTTGSACSIEVQNASTVWPERVRPLRSTTVTLIQSGRLGRRRLRRGHRGLRVQRVEDRLDQQQVDPAILERAHLLGVGLDHLVERDRTEAGIVDFGREGERHVERPDRSGDESLASGAVGGVPREPGALAVHVDDGALEAVVPLAERGRGERVRGGDVGAGREVRVVHLGHDLRPGDVEQIWVALDVVVVVGEPLAPELLLGQPTPLQQHPPCAVEHGDPAAEQALDACAGVHSSHPSGGPCDRPHARARAIEERPRPTADPPHDGRPLVRRPDGGVGSVS